MNKKTKSRKSRLNPSKLLVLLMYGSYPYLDVRTFSPNIQELVLDIGSFSRLMRVKKIHIAESLEWLDAMGYISLIEIDNKKATVLISTPPLFGTT